MHSSRMPTTRSSSCSGWVSASVHAGIPPGVGLEIPPAVSLETPPARLLNFPLGCGPGDLQGMLGYYPPGDLLQGIPPAMYAGIPHPPSPQ